MSSASRSADDSSVPSSSTMRVGSTQPGRRLRNRSTIHARSVITRLSSSFILYSSGRKTKAAPWSDNHPPPWPRAHGSRQARKGRSEAALTHARAMAPRNAKGCLRNDRKRLAQRRECDGGAGSCLRCGRTLRVGGGRSVDLSGRGRGRGSASVRVLESVRRFGTPGPQRAPTRPRRGRRSPARECPEAS